VPKNLARRIYGFDLLGPAGGAAAAGRTMSFLAIFRLGATMELGRSEPMLMSASPGRGGGDGAAALGSFAALTRAREGRADCSEL
jgi:hypothetical protein